MLPTARFRLFRSQMIAAWLRREICDGLTSLARNSIVLFSVGCEEFNPALSDGLSRLSPLRTVGEGVSSHAMEQRELSPIRSSSSRVVRTFTPNPNNQPSLGHSRPVRQRLSATQTPRGLSCDAPTTLDLAAARRLFPGGDGIGKTNGRSLGTAFGEPSG